LKKRITYIISDINKAVAFEWIASFLDRERFDLTFILLNPGSSVLETYLRQHSIPCKTIRCRSKKDWLICLWKLCAELRRSNPHIVHTHLLQANILGLIAAKLSGIPVRIHTRHHSSLHHTYFKKGIFWDKLANRLSTHIIAISKPVREILVEWERADERKIRLIPHGFLLNAFDITDPQLTSRIAEKYNAEKRYPIVGVVSRFTEWKGVQYIIPAFLKLLGTYPNARLLLFNADGDYKEEIGLLLKQLPAESYQAITFEEQINAAYQLFDVCVHTPVDAYSEAFGQVYIEALAAGVPLIASLSGIAPDILVHRQNAWVVPYRDTQAIAEGLLTVLSDISLQHTIKEYGRQTASAFSIEKMIDQLSELYATA
jgi:glycosyltransferase involved in cell wall biosynthesis